MKNQKPKLTVVKNTMNDPASASEIKNLNRIKGQVEAVIQMIQNGRRVDDILTQLSAARSAIKSLESRVLSHHIQKTISDIRDGETKTDAVDDLIALFDKRLH